MRLKDDGTLATQPSDACRFVSINLKQQRIVPLVGCSNVSVAACKNPSTVLRDFRHLGALAAAIGTFTWQHKPVGNPKYMRCFDWDKVLRLSETTPGCASADVFRWSFYCNDDSNGGLAFGVDADSSPEQIANSPLTQVPAGTLIVHPQKYLNASGHCLIKAMITNPAQPLPITDAIRRADYQNQFDHLNPRDTSMTGSSAYAAVKGAEKRTRLGIAKKNTDWVLFAVCSANSNVSTGNNNTGYQIDDLALELVLEGFTEVVLFDAGSPFQLAIWDGRTIMADEYGIPVQATSNAFVFIAPKQIHWKKIGNNIIPNSRPDPGAPATIVVAPSSPQDMVVNIELVNMNIFGEAVKVEAELQCLNHILSAATINPSEITWTDIDKASVAITFKKADLQAPAPIGSEFTLRARSRCAQLWQDYEIDCTELSVKIDGNKRWCAVVDDSGSMNTSDPAFSALGAVARLAMSIFADPDIGVGMSIVRFTESASSLTGGLSADLNRILTMTGSSHWHHDGETNITAGLNAALADIGPAALFEDHNVLLLTDGLDQNFDYSVVARLRTAKIKVHAMALGQGADRALLERIARDTGGQYMHATTISELLRRIGTLEEVVSNVQLVDSVNLPNPGNLLIFVMANHDMNATLTASSGALNPAFAQLFDPSGRACTLAQIIENPALIPGVSVTLDPNASGGGQNRFLIVNFNGGIAQQGEWRLGMVDQPTTIRVVEEPPPGEEYKLVVSGVPQNLAVFVGGKPFALTCAWFVSGIQTDADSIGCTLISPTGMQDNIQFDWVGVGKYVWTIDPVLLNLQPGMHEITIACAAPLGAHRRQWHLSFNVYRQLNAVFPELPSAIVAEESFNYSFQVPGGSQGVTAWLELTDGISTMRTRLNYQSTQAGNAIYGASINLNDMTATASGMINIEASEEDRYAFRSGNIRILPARGVWLLSNTGSSAVDILGNRRGSILQKSKITSIDGGNGNLWTSEIMDGYVWLHAYDRKGRRRSSIKTCGDAIWSCAAYNGHVAAMLRVMEGGKPKAMMIMYKAGVGELCRYPGANGPLLMINENELYYGERIPLIADSKIKVMCLKQGNIPVTCLPGFSESQLEICQMPDNRVAFWLGKGQPLRGMAANPPFQELTEKLDGQLVLAHQYGFWLCTIKPGLTGSTVPMKLYHYAAMPSHPGQFIKREILLPSDLYKTLDGAAVNRSSGTLFLGENRSKDNLWIFSTDGKCLMKATGDVIAAIYSMISNEGPYPR